MTDETVNDENNEKDKLRNGPCHETFALLDGCRKAKNVQKASNALTFCVSETDLLIRCIRRHPAYFGPAGDTKK
jgi:GCK domain